MRVLIVDDDGFMRDLLSAFISDLGYTPISLQSGEAALEHIQSDPPDLILLDVAMAGMDGFQTAREIRKILGKRWLPIIFLSAKTDNEHFVRGIDAGGDAYLPKPPKAPVVQAMVRAMGRIHDIQQELYNAKVEMEKLAHMDALTRVVNRRGLDTYLSKEWLRSTREGTCLSVIMLDIDYFKPYNDHYGHAQGDKCLRQVATTLDSALHRPGDLIARYGGEEFTVVLPNTPLPGAVEVAHRLQHVIDEAAIPHEYSQVRDQVTISMGIAQRTNEPNMRQFLALADKHLYAAKEEGRDQYYIG